MNNDFKKSFINGLGGFLGVIIIPLLGFGIYKIAPTSIPTIKTTFRKLSGRVKRFTLPESREFKKCEIKAFRQWQFTLDVYDKKQLIKFLKENPGDLRKLANSYDFYSFGIYREGMCGMTKAEKERRLKWIYKKAQVYTKYVNLAPPRAPLSQFETNSNIYNPLL